MNTLTAEQQKHVLDSAVHLFTQHEPKEISLDQLAGRCGVSALDIVRHYQSREAILAAVLERELMLMAAAAHHPEFRMRDELHILGVVILQEYRARLPFLGKLLTEAMRSPDVGALFYQTFIRQGRLLFTEFLNERKSLGELRENVDVEAAAAIFLAALTGPLLLTELYGGARVEQLDDERLLDQIADVFLKGVERK